MFSSVRNFYRRNRNKILFSGLLVGGVYAAGKLINSKYEEWQLSKVEEEQDDARRDFHFESHQKTCTTTFISFLPNIRNLIMEKLDTEQLLEILKMKPANKLEIWEQLKTFSLSRVLCSVISNVLLLVILKVKMNIIGAYLFAIMSKRSQTNASDFDIEPIDPNSSQASTSHTNIQDPPLFDKEDSPSDIQLKYLSNIRYFVEDMLPALVDECLEVVEQSISKITLKDKLTHERVKELCDQVLTTLKAKHTSLNNVKHEFCYYFVNPSLSELEDTTDSDAYSRLVCDTVNVLESIDCSLVIDKCLQCGVDQALGNFKDNFMTSEEHDPNVDLNECLTKNFFTDELPMAKVIPILNKQIHEIFKMGPNPFLDVLFSQDLLRRLSRNVYESTIKEYTSCFA